MEDIIKSCTGWNIKDRLAGKAKDAFTSVMDYMHAGFGDNVDYERLLDLVLYCPETRDYLYAVPEVPKYQKGSRPFLEAEVEKACKGSKTDREKALALMCYIRDLKQKSNGYDYFFGGTEEDLIKKGERYCERVARLMSGLCDVAGIPARTLFHVSGGHHTAEVFVEGKWAYIDPRFALFYIDENNKMLSLEELVQNPDIVFHQPAWVYEYASDEKPIEAFTQRNHDEFFRKEEIQCYGPYSLSDAEKFHFNWLPSMAFPMEERDKVYRWFQTARKAYIADPEQYKDGIFIS